MFFFFSFCYLVICTIKSPDFTTFTLIFKMKIVRVCIVLLCLVHLSFSQNFTVSGYVKEKKNGESAIGATIYFPDLKKGTTTNVYGFFSITLPKGKYTIQCSYLGFQTINQAIQLDKDIQLNFSLEPTAITTDEVTVTTDRPDENIKSSQMGAVTLDIKQIKSLPAFMGEVDIMKTIQLLPGVKSAGDGQTGFYVRGGGPDQNLILLDEAIVYNASHLMGFFSVFNGDAIKNVNLIKGGMPAQYGQRLSSVLDITMKEGNNQNFQVDGGIGLIASRLTVQGPLKKDRSSFIISARRTYIDVIIKPIFKEGKSEFAGTSYYFYDLNTKFNYKISDKDKLFLSGYFGRDKFKFNDKESGFNIYVPWGNATGSFRWNHVFNPKLFCNTSLIYSLYNFEFGATQDENDFKLYSGIRDHTVKTDFNWYPSPRHNVKFGSNYTYHIFIPTNVSAKQGETKFDLGEVVKLYSHEAHIYASDDWEINDWLKIHGGLRASYFAHVGPFTRYRKNEFQKTTDTIVYARGKKIADYFNVEPRFSARFELNRKTAIKASYTRNYQYIHLASISSVSLPTDVWMPSTDIIKPQEGNQYALGIFRNFKKDMFETSFELYYKNMKNQIEYREGAEPQDDVKDNPDNNFVFGRGEAYGGEIFIKKREGKLTGWIGYTLSWTKRTFPDINFGKTFYAKYDRRHDVSFVSTYEYNPKWTFSAVWVYSTGNAGTLPNSLYFFEQAVSVYYGTRNSYRFPAYHRMDISVTFTPDRQKQIARRKARLEKRYTRKGKSSADIVLPKKWAKNFQSSWTFSVFNAYNRYNPYFIYFDTQGNLLDGNFKVQAKQVSLFPVLPSVTWNFKF